MRGLRGALVVASAVVAAAGLCAAGPSSRALVIRPTAASAAPASGGPAARSSSDAALTRAGVRAPRVRQMVVLRDGSSRVRTVSARSAHVEVGRRRCAVAAATPLAALVRSRVAALELRDYGSCSRRGGDGGGLFVRAIAHDRNEGSAGWVYKVGRRLGTAGAADPAGPFGSGRLRSGARVVWFYCALGAYERSCQRTLAVEPRARRGGAVAAAVTAYDDAGRGIAAAGATVRAGTVVAAAGPDGVARLELGRGPHRLWAERAGFVRSFSERVVVRR